MMINIIQLTSIRHNHRSMVMMDNTGVVALPGPSMQQTMTEPLPLARPRLDDPLQPDQSLAEWQHSPWASVPCAAYHHNQCRCSPLLHTRWPFCFHHSHPAFTSAAMSASTSDPCASHHSLAEESQGRAMAAGPGGRCSPQSTEKDIQTFCV